MRRLVLRKGHENTRHKKSHGRPSEPKKWVGQMNQRNQMGDKMNQRTGGPNEPKISNMDQINQ